MQQSTTPIAIFWHRRDLRIQDNAGLYHALRCGLKVLPLFIFDTDILEKLDSKTDARVQFIHQSIKNLNEAYRTYGSGLMVKFGQPAGIFRELLHRFQVRAVFANKDYEPYARQRDEKIAALLKPSGISMYLFKDHVICEQDEVAKPDGSPYTVFTPYMRKWKERVAETGFRTYDPLPNVKALLPDFGMPIPSLREIGFMPSVHTYPGSIPNIEIIRHYHLTRDLPALQGTTRLGLHLRFGTVSIRTMVQLAWELNEIWLNELIWREFFQAILYRFPHTIDQAFKPAYDRIQWVNNEAHFNAWCQGCTGYPLVDAGMRELKETGFMPNRVRMVTASFLCKHLLIDWRLGEAWFAGKLLDFEQASNIGNWQWASGSGCDAAPYFRIFSPELQAKKFDPQGSYVKRWVPEAGNNNYVQPIVNHDFARKRAIEAYKTALMS